MVGLFIYFVYRLFQSVTMPASLISLPFLIVVCLPLQCTSFNLALGQHTAHSTSAPSPTELTNGPVSWLGLDWLIDVQAAVIVISGT